MSAALAPVGLNAGGLNAGPGFRDFFVCDIFDASPKNDLGSMEHPMFSLSTRPDLRQRRYAHNGMEITVTPSVKGRATIHDKDILIYCISQLMAALNAGRAISRTLRLTVHDLLTATRRDTGGDSYTRLRESFERLAGTRITTNIAMGGVETTSGFGLIEAWQIVRRAKGGRMISVTVTLSEWLFRAVSSQSVLTLSRDYFGLRKPLERRVYELARKHCGGQREWRISLGLLHTKAGSDAPVRVFRAAIRKMIAADTLPDYAVSEDAGDIIRFSRRSLLDDEGAVSVRGAQQIPPFGPEMAAAVRSIAPGLDPYALEAEWRAGAAGKTGKRARNAAEYEAEFLVWVRTRVAG